MSDRRIGAALVGLGLHARRSLLPAFAASPDVRLEAVVVRDVAAARAAVPDLAARLTDDFAAVLADPGVALVMVATPTAAHPVPVRAALEGGKHVWCEKPLTADLETTRALLALAASRGLMLAEVAMYGHHRQFARLLEIVAERRAAGARLVAARSRFSIPPLPPGDFRYRPEDGGGALLDIGFYPLSAAGALFGMPRSIAASGYTCPQRGVDLSGTAALDYGDFGYHAVWALGAAYASEIELSYNDATYRAERAFSKPATLTSQIAVTAVDGSARQPITVAPDDQFGQLFAHHAALLHADDRAGYATLAAQAEQSATIMDAVRRALVR